ncbi:Uncharacterised protein g6948 [Pycnogonum litorale]
MSHQRIIDDDDDDTRSVDNIQNGSPFKRPRLQILIDSVAVLFCGMDASTLGSFFPQQAYTKGMSSKDVGIVVGVFSVASACFTPVWGALMVVKGFKYVFVINCVLAFAGSVGLAFVMNAEEGPFFYSVCVINRLIEGIGSSGLQVVCFAHVAQVYPSRKVTLVGFMEMCNSLGHSIGPGFGGLMFATFGFETPYLVNSGMITLIFLIGYFIMEEPLIHEIQDKEMQDTIKMSDVLRIPEYVLMLLWPLSVSMILGFKETIISPFITDTFQVTVVTSGIMMTIGTVGYVIFALLVGYLVDKRVKPEYALLLGGSISTLSLLFIGPVPFLGLKPHLISTAVCLVLFAIANSLMLIPTYAILIEVQRRNNITDSVSSQNVNTTIILSVFSIGNVLGPVVSGALDDAFGYRWITLFFACFIFILLIMNVCNLAFREKSSYNEIDG